MFFLDMTCLVNHSITPVKIHSFKTQQLNFRFVICVLKKTNISLFSHSPAFNISIQLLNTNCHTFFKSLQSNWHIYIAIDTLITTRWWRLRARSGVHLFHFLYAQWKRVAPGAHLDISTSIYILLYLAISLLRLKLLLLSNIKLIILSC